MRTLVLLRGAPGCGKTTWIRENGLSNYTLSADDIRKLYASPMLLPDGNCAISQWNDKVVWKTLFEILENRMKNGDFTVIDACNSKTAEMTRYRDLAHEYRYRIYCVDFTSIDINEVKRRNAEREPLKQVPEEYIDRVYSRFETQQIPSGVVRILPEEYRQRVYVEPFDMSQYKKIVHVGDIHGCYDRLMEAVPEIEDDVGYIFLGDYCDRGPDSAKVIAYLLSIYRKPNVCLLEGNHERHLWDWANNRASRSKEFEYKTRPQLERAGIDKKAVRDLYRKMRQCSWYLYQGEQVFCTHGGIPNYKKSFNRPDFIPAHQMTHGVGQYEDVVAVTNSFNEMGDMWQVFGHRNVLNDMSVNYGEKSMCLDGGVERGGELRKLTYADGEWTLERYANPIEAVDIEPVVSDEAVLIHDVVDKMRQSKLVQEKQFGHISSFNFTRQAFADKKWNELTTKARGLFIDTVNNKIVARGYDKFFAIGERFDTTLTSLEHRIAFPVDIYIKSNGFLGMVSYDQAVGQLFMTTKSSPDGPMADLFRSKIADWRRQKMEDYLKEHDVTLLFECVDPVNDPHIITYDRDDIILLDAVTNKLDPEYLPYDDLLKLSKYLGCSIKGKCIPSRVDSMASLRNVIEWIENIDTDSIEGVVLRDANGLMLKQKTQFYNEWKKMRSVANSVLKTGNLRNPAICATPMENYFLAFMKTLFKREDIKTAGP